MMNQSLRVGRAIKSGKYLAFGIIFGLAFLASSAISHAQATYYWIAPGSDIWTDGNAWTTNGGNSMPIGLYPGESSLSDDTRFTNASIYTVTLAPTDDSPSYLTQITSNIYDNASNTTMTVTIETAGNQLNIVSGGVMTIGNQATSTSIVYLDSSSNAGGQSGSAGYGAELSGATLNIGRQGNGTLIVTNGVLDANGINLASDDGGQGTLIVSGPNTVVSFGQAGASGSNGGMTIGATNSAGNTVIVTNGAQFGNLLNSTHGTFRLGSGSSWANTSNNTFTVVAGGQLLMTAGTITIGNGGTQTAAPGSYNNLMLIGNGGIMDCGANRNTSPGTSHGIWLGTSHATPNSNNVIRVLSGGSFHSFSTTYITASNTIDVLGGNVGGVYSNAIGSANPTNGIVLYNNGNITNIAGTLQGWGQFMCTVNNLSNSVFATSNSVSSIVFSNNLNIFSNATTVVQLGASPATTFPSITASNVLIQGGPNSTLKINSSGAIANGTYVLFTNTCSTCISQLVFQGWANVTGPAGPTYTVGVSTNVSGGGTNAILLTVSGAASPALLQITSIVKTNSGNDIFLTWTTGTSSTNVVQLSTVGPNGSYTSNFVNLSTNIIVTGLTNTYLDVGGATNRPTRYYRIHGF